MRSGADIELGELRSGGQVLDVEITRVDGGLDIAFADPFVRAGLIELDFASTIYRQQMPFEAFLASGREERQVRQRVDVGDAIDAVASEVIAVALPVGPALIDELALSAALVTPNGRWYRRFVADRVCPIKRPPAPLAARGTLRPERTESPGATRPAANSRANNVELGWPGRIRATGRAGKLHFAGCGTRRCADA